MTSSLNFDKYLLVPFESQGRSPKGADCWGLLWMIYKEMLGIELELFDTTSAYRWKSVAKLIEQHKQTWHLVKPHDVPRIFDVAIMRTQAASEDMVAHLGVIAGRNRMIHTEKGIGVRIEDIRSPIMKSRIIEIRRHHTLDEAY